MFKLYPQKKRPSSANRQKTNRLYRKQTANASCKALISKESCVHTNIANSQIFTDYLDKILIFKYFGNHWVFDFIAQK